MLEVESSLVKIFFLLTLITLSFLNTSCSRKENTSHSSPPPFRILLDPPPINLNPRASLDATSQRINELLFRALTRLDSNLVPLPDLASKWEVLDDGKTWKFPILKNQKDQSNQVIDSEKMRQCLENYRIGSPTSVFRTALPHWISTETLNDSVIIRLKAPDPYLPRNLSLLRYFRTSESSTPCSEPLTQSSLIGSGNFKAETWDFSPQNHFILTPSNPSSSLRKLELVFNQDDDTKALKLLRGEVDAIQNSISLSKTRWIEHKAPEQFKVLERPGVSVSYLAFNFNDPLLSRKEVRKAIALSIDRESIVRNKHLGFTHVASSLLSPLLPESSSTAFEYNPNYAETLLDQAGFPRGKEGIRFQLRYKSTPAKEGIETAFMLQDMLGKVGIKIWIDVVEPAVFFASIKKGHFQLYSSRWIGVADGSILYNSIRSGQHLNRIHYLNSEIDQLLDSAVSTTNTHQRILLMKQIQILIAEDLPYFPLWYWDIGLILRKEIWEKNRNSFSGESLSLSGSLEPLTHLR